MNIIQIVLAILQGALTLIAMMGTFYLRDLTDSVKLLNVNVATIIEKTKIHTKELDDHEDRLRDLERK